MGLKITNMVTREVVYDSRDADGAEFMGAGQFGVTYFPERADLPVVKPQPTAVTDLPWMTPDENESWFEKRFGPLNGEAEILPTDIDDFDETDEDESEDE